MLSLIYVMLHKKHIYVIVVPDICCKKIPQHVHVFFLGLQYAGPMSSLDTVSKFIVSQWDHTNSTRQLELALQNRCLANIVYYVP